MHASTWQILIDVSGMPPDDDIYIGLILFNENYKPKFSKEWFSAFPQVRDYHNKASQTKGDTLLEVLKFFDEKRLRMVCYHFSKSQWKMHERRINELIKDINGKHHYRSNFHHFIEKIMGILYFEAIKQIGVRGQTYYVTACHESCIDIWTVLQTLQKLAKRDGWDIRPSTNIRKIELTLKAADFVAGANRKLPESALNSVGRHTVLSDPVDDADLKYVFNIRKRSTKYGP